MVMRVGRVQRWHKAAVVAGGLMVVAAGCGTTVDAVVVMAPVPVPLPTPQDGSTILPANPELDLPAVTAAPAPEIVLPAPTTTVPPAPVGPQPEPVPALAAPLTPVKPGSSGPGGRGDRGPAPADRVLGRRARPASTTPSPRRR